MNRYRKNLEGVMFDIKYAVIVGMISILFVCPIEAQQRANRRPPQNRSNVQRDRNAQTERAVLSYLEQFETDILSELKQLKANRPRLYRRQIEKFFIEMKRLERVRETDKSHYNNLLEEKRLELLSLQVSRQYKKSDDDEARRALAVKLTELVNRSFDLRQKNRQREIEKLEQRVVELKTENEKRLQNKADIVSERVKQLKGETQEIQW